MKIANQYNNQSVLYLDNIVSPLYYKRFPKEIFDKYIVIEFENTLVKSIEQYDLYLTQIYGEYMKLPPIEKQVAHHEFLAYWRE